MPAHNLTSSPTPPLCWLDGARVTPAEALPEVFITGGEIQVFYLDSLIPDQIRHLIPGDISPVVARMSNSSQSGESLQLALGDYFRSFEAKDFFNRFSFPLESALSAKR